MNNHWKIVETNGKIFASENVENGIDNIVKRV